MSKNGSTRKILRVDLTTGEMADEIIASEVYRLYPGGKALGAYLLLREVPRGADPFGPDNRLYLMNGLLTAAPISTATRFTAIARSPLSGGYGESEAGGFWGPELKLAGWEGIALSGQAPHPVYLWIHDDHVELRDARQLWGTEPEFTQNWIREQHGDKLIRVLQIGAGGENRVRFAAITNDLRHYNGRTGMGAVMGSKNLKAVAVRGSSKYLDLAHDPKTLAALGRNLAKRVKEHPQAWDLQDKGTPGLTRGLNTAGILPTRNFREGAFAGAENLMWEQYEKQLLTARRSCYACAVRCKREVKLDDRYQVSDAYGGPEYEAVCGFGANCAIDDLQAVAKANELCGRYTLDVISCSNTIGFAMECFEHELLSLEDTGGIELRFGNAAAMLKMVELIARREGFGNVLADGVKRLADKLGGDAHLFAMHVKGQEMPMHEPRGKVAVGLAYATSEVGAEHLSSFHDPLIANAESVSFKSSLPLGIREAIAPRVWSDHKVEFYSTVEKWNSAEKVIGLCYFGPAPRSFIQVDEVVTAVRAATGWDDFTVQDILRVGERATNLARVFNSREGFTRKDDTLPERLFQPLEGGPLKGEALSRADFEHALDVLYHDKGYDPTTGAPTRERLHELEMEWVADAMDEA